MSKHPVIGIDLGTTYSAVAAYDTYQDQAEIIGNQDAGSEPTTPSVVGLDPVTRRVIVGRPAKQNLPTDPDNTIIEIKREMGELFREDTLDKYRARGVYAVGDPVRASFADQFLLPQEISAFILMKMKEIAEREMGTEIRDAVVTVPAYFKEVQRRATEQAALLAGLYPRQLIPEPTAAAICYGVDRFQGDRRVYLVYDLGGGTFDVSIIEVEGDHIGVIATSGDPRLGGGDFDDVLTAWVVEELARDHQLDVSNNPQAKARIKYQAEQAKIQLSTFESVPVTLVDLRPQRPPEVVLTRAEFVRRIEPLVNKSLTFVERALNDASARGVTREQIDAILLVGGSTRIPMVKSKLINYFGRDESFLRDDVDPAAAVARGAAVLAYRCAPSPPPFDLRRRQSATLVNVTAEADLIVEHIAEHTLGVGVQSGRFDPLVSRGTNIPVTVKKSDYTNPEQATQVQVPVFQGESEFYENNTLIGTLHIAPIDPAPQGHHRFEVTFGLDRNGLLSVTVMHVNTGRVFQARFEHDTTVTGDDALEAMRAKLLPLYQPAGTGYQPPPPPGTAAPPPPAPSDGAAAAAAPEAAPAAAAEAPAAPAPAPGQPAVLDRTEEVPDQFKQTERRARKELMRNPSPELLEAYNAFVAALNEGRTEEDLVDLGDALADAYDDARH